MSMRFWLGWGEARRLRLGVLGLFLATAAGCKDDGVGAPCASSGCKAGLVCLGGPQGETCQTCWDSHLCDDEGLCSFSAGRCAASRDVDCAKSRACTEEGRCRSNGSTCAKPQNAGSKAKPEEGCPCGCDHSEAMAAELKEQSAPEALDAIARTLAIIAEREDRGFITEAMVEHRLRLSKLGAELGRAWFPRPAHLAEVTAARAIRAGLPFQEGDGLRVRHQLVTHAETTELVGGLPKLHRACFLLWLEVDNTSGTPRRLERPQVRGAVPFEITRWYVEDGDGHPFDGHLSPGERRSLLVIGYLGDALAPGDRVNGIVELGNLSFTATSRARGRWDAVD